MGEARQGDGAGGAEGDGGIDRATVGRFHLDVAEAFQEDGRVVVVELVEGFDGRDLGGAAFVGGGGAWDEAVESGDEVGDEIAEELEAREVGGFGGDVVDL